MSKKAKRGRRRREVAVAVEVDPTPTEAENQLVERLARFLVAITKADKPA